MIDSTRPVFVDASGRRRRLMTVVGTVVGAALAAGIAVLVAGLVGPGSLPLPGLPAGGQGIQREQPVPAAEPSPSVSTTPSGRTPAPEAPDGPAGPAGPATTSTGPATPAPGPVVSSTTRGNRPTAHPGNAKPSRTR